MSPALSARDVFLRPGECFVGAAPRRASTLLGSCVSVTLWHPARRIGAMSHFLVASRARKPNQDLDARYGEEAIAQMLRSLHHQGVEPTECEAKLFGGGDMFALHGKPGQTSIGRRNGLAAHALLGQLGIRVCAEHLYGQGHRQITFHLDTGAVWVRQMPLRVVS